MTKAGESILRGAREALAFSEGKDVGARVHVPDQVDVRAIRRRAGLSQEKFAATFGFPVASLRNWEQGRRRPDVTSRALLLVIDHSPETVREALTGGGAAKEGQPIQKASARARSHTATP